MRSPAPELYQSPPKVVFFLPGFTINRLCAASLYGLARAAPGVALNTRKWATTALGLGVIPFIVHPIDTLVHYGMDNTTRSDQATCVLYNECVY